MAELLKTSSRAIIRPAKGYCGVDTLTAGIGSLFRIIRSLPQWHLRGDFGDGVVGDCIWWGHSKGRCLHKLETHALLGCVKVFGY